MLPMWKYHHPYSVLHQTLSQLNFCQSLCCHQLWKKFRCSLASNRGMASRKICCLLISQWWETESAGSTLQESYLYATLSFHSVHMGMLFRKHQSQDWKCLRKLFVVFAPIRSSIRRRGALIYDTVILSIYLEVLRLVELGRSNLEKHRGL